MPDSLRAIILFGAGILVGGIWLPVERATAQEDQFAGILKLIEERCEVEIPIQVGVEVFHEVGFFSRNSYGYGTAEGISYGEITCR